VVVISSRGSREQVVVLAGGAGSWWEAFHPILTPFIYLAGTMPMPRSSKVCMQ
jgi:hypothetical protein